MILRALVVAVLALAAPVEILAAPITFTFTGNVSIVSSELTGTFNNSQTLSGSYTFESLSPDLNPGNATFGQYSPLVLNSLSLSIGSYTVGRVGPVSVADNIFVSNNVGGSIDEYRPNWAPLLNGADVAGRSPDNFRISLVDSTGTPISSDALPLLPPDLTAFNQNPFWQLSFTGGLFVLGALTSLDLAPVPEPIPEPATLLLFGTTVAGLGLARWRQRRRKQQTSIAGD